MNQAAGPLTNRSRSTHRHTHALQSTSFQPPYIRAAGGHSKPLPTVKQAAAGWSTMRCSLHCEDCLSAPHRSTARRPQSVAQRSAAQHSVPAQQVVTLSLMASAR